LAPGWFWSRIGDLDWRQSAWRQRSGVEGDHGVLLAIRYSRHEFIIYRYTDPFRNDDAWAYVPTLRRVRRVSVETKYDSLLGPTTRWTNFYGYAGRTLETDWKFLGWKDVLCVCDPAKMYDHLYGPNGIIPDEDWELRRQIVLERIPKNPRHPYSSAIMFIDPQIWFDSFHVAFDHSESCEDIQWQWK